MPSLWKQCSICKRALVASDEGSMSSQVYTCAQTNHVTKADLGLGGEVNLSSVLWVIMSFADNKNRATSTKEYLISMGVPKGKCFVKYAYDKNIEEYMGRPIRDEEVCHMVLCTTGC